jgi:hypothetical protein
MSPFSTLPETLRTAVGAGAAAAALALLGACTPDPPAPPDQREPGPGAAQPVEEDWQDRAGAEGFPQDGLETGRADELRWRGEIQPRWPRGWRLVGRGRFGDTDRPVAWLRFEAPGTAVDELASEALDPLEPVAGEIELRSVARDGSGLRAVAQMRGQLLRAAADATAGEGQSVVSLTIETRPGVLATPGG